MTWNRPAWLAEMAAWALAAATIVLLVASLLGEGTGILGHGEGAGWSWFVLAGLAAGAAAIVLLTSEPTPPTRMNEVTPHESR